jgi:copper chaperone
MQTTRLKVTGMSCQSCVAHTKKALESVEGVRSVAVSLEKGGAVVEHEEAAMGELLSAVAEEGYEARVEV